MKKYTKLSTLLFLIAAFTSCEGSVKTTLSNGLNITIGRVCGWCTGQDELAISQETCSYYYDHACGDSLDVPKKFFNTPKAEWEKLVSLLDKNEFKNIDINTCNVCADGCDIWVIVEDSGYSHTIRFGDESEVGGSQRKYVSTLQNLISKVREDFDVK